MANIFAILNNTIKLSSTLMNFEFQNESEELEVYSFCLLKNSSLVCLSHFLFKVEVQKNVLTVANSLTFSCYKQ